MDSHMITTGYLAYRVLPGGRLIGVIPLTFGRARVVITDDAHGYSYGSVW